MADVQKKCAADVFPLLLPCDYSCLSYSGPINIKGHEFWIHLQVSDPDPRNPLKEAGLEVDWQLKFLLKDFEDFIAKLLIESSSLVEFLEQFKQFLEDLLQTKGVAPKERLPTCSFYQCICEELDEVGWDKVLFVEPDLSTVKLQCQDEGNRTHQLDIHLPQQYPVAAPVCHTDLPAVFTPKWKSKGCLINVWNQFEISLKQFQQFWDVLDEIDQRVWVLEPINPNRSTRMRRFLVGKNTSIRVTLNPIHPTTLPEYKFYGPEKDVVQLNTKFSKEMDKWNNSVSLLVNIENILELNVPSKSELTKEEVMRDCGVCFNHSNDSGETPDVVCSVDKCAQAYHRTCIIEWIRRHRQFRKSFNLLYGECPFCRQPLQVEDST